jgi:hypothetical protein
MPYSHREVNGVFRIVLSGAVSVEEIDRMASEMEAAMAGRSEWPDNLFDLRNVDLSGLGFVDMMSLAKRIAATAPPHPYRTAIAGESQVVIGFARMFQSLNLNPSITIEVFESIEAAEAWLRQPRRSTT